MKITNILNEQATPPMIYHAEFEYGKGLDDFAGEAVEGEPGPDGKYNFAEEIGLAKEEFDIQEGFEISPGVWMGYRFSEPDFDEWADEDGPGMTVIMSGDVIVVSAQPLNLQGPLYHKIAEEIDSRAEDEISNVQAELADDEAYNSDPYAYHGVRRSDF